MLYAFVFETFILFCVWNKLTVTIAQDGVVFHWDIINGINCFIYHINKFVSASPLRHKLLTVGIDIANNKITVSKPANTNVLW